MKYDERQIIVFCCFCKTQVTEKDKVFCQKCERRIFYGPSKAWLETEEAFRLAAKTKYYH